MANEHISLPSRRIQDLTGEIFGRYTVIRYDGYRNNTTFWMCRCECGNDRSVAAGLLKGGRSKSCGCLKRELARRPGKNRKHGLRKSPIYKSWQAMIERCTKVTHEAYGRYGGAGVRICERLRSSPEGIVAVIGDRPEGQTLDRYPDRFGNYCCGKCDDCRNNGWSLNIRWATPLQQGRNRRDNQTLTFNGETLTVTEWSERTGINTITIRQRKMRGWSDKDSLTVEVKH